MENPHKERSKPISERSTLIIIPKEEETYKQVERYTLETSSEDNCDKSTLIVDAPTQTPTRPDLSVNSQLSKYFSSLNPEQLWQGLFKRLFKGKISRLYFKCQKNNSSIVALENGVPQLAIDNLTQSTYRYLIQKLKDITNLSPDPVTKTKKFEVQRWYKQERILLCLQLSPSKYGEEGTLQILRGKALEFYQQQQMDELGQEALQLAKQLERKLRQIQLRTRINPQALENLNELKQINQQIRQTLQKIGEKTNS